MRLIICDVGNAACAIITSPSGYAMMVDCGSCDTKTNPVVTFNRYKDWLGAKDYVKRWNLAAIGTGGMRTKSWTF